MLISGSEDIVLCRTYRGLQKRIQKEGESAGLKCQVHYWAGAWEVEELFQKLEPTVEVNETHNLLTWED